MSKKIIFLLLVLVLFSRSHLVFASPVINELMYDLDGADIDWVEIYNPDNVDVDLTSLKLLVSNSTSNHGITKHSGSEILHKGDYGIIVPSSDILDYINKWGSSGNIFTASFSLPNESEKVEINNGDKNIPLSSFTYSSTQGASGDGNSLQFINGSWVAASPTPGFVNKNSIPPLSSSGGLGLNVDSSNSNITTDINSSSTVDSKKKEKIPEVPTIKTKITAKNLVFAGLPVEFKAGATGLSGESLSYGKYFWNFGDGDSKEVNNTEKFTHTYSYSGEYAVSLEYYSNTYSQTSDATDKTIIKVVPIKVSISKVGNEKDFFVELTNNSEYEIDISKWALIAGDKKFIFPKNSILLPKKAIMLSSQITKFFASDTKNLKLTTPSGEIVYDYGSSLLPVETITKNDVSTQILTPVTNKSEVSLAKNIQVNNFILKDKNKKSIENVTTSETQIPIKNLSASPIESGTIPIDSKNSNLLIIALVVFLGLSASSVYFIRRNKATAEADEDFEILDE